MHGEQHPARVVLRQAREATIEQLSDSFAHDELSLEEFEQRVDRAYAAESREEVQALVSDLTASETKMRVATEPPVPIAANHGLVRRTERRVALAIFGKVERRGRFALAFRSKALAVFGNVAIDLRDAIIADGVAEIQVEAIFGNIEIIVPPTLSVECHGVGIFGNFEGLERVPYEPDGTPTLRITGKAVFGNVEVKTLVRGQARPVITSGMARLRAASELTVHSPRQLPPKG